MRVLRIRENMSIYGRSFISRSGNQEGFINIFNQRLYDKYNNHIRISDLLVHSYARLNLLFF